MIAFSNFVFDRTVAFFQRLQILISNIGVPIGACYSSIALASDKECTNVRLVSSLLLCLLTVMLQSNLSQGLLKCLVLIGQCQFFNIHVDIVGPEVFVGLFLWHKHQLTLVDEFVPKFHRKAKIQIK